MCDPSLPDRLRLAARAMFPDDDTPCRLDAVLDETDRANPSGAAARVLALLTRYEDTVRGDRYVMMPLEVVTRDLRAALALVPVARHWRGAA